MQALVPFLVFGLSRSGRESRLVAGVRVLLCIAPFSCLCAGVQKIHPPNQAISKETRHTREKRNLVEDAASHIMGEEPLVTNFVCLQSIKLGDDAAAAKQPNRNKNNTY